ncbi:MAG TPA: hypothetical protein VI383_08125 [Gemmatimonadales bacterium]|nr:hypothetical protein [Gemmatimonadales bacterium]
MGEEVVTEMVDWFNAVDATYRADLREFNELNFSRFDAKLEQRMAELCSELSSRMDQLETRLERRLGEQTRWFIAAWGVVLVAIIGLWFRK